MTTSMSRHRRRVGTKDSVAAETRERTGTGEGGPSGRSGGRRGSLTMLAALPAPLRLVIITQFAFNVGFYLVVPVIEEHLANDIMLA